MSLELPSGLKEKTLADYDPKSPHQAAAKKIVERIISHDPEMKDINGLWFYGPFGTGKTHLQAALFNGFAAPAEKKLWVPPFGSISKHPLVDAYTYNSSEFRKRFDDASAIFMDEFTLANINRGSIDALTNFLQSTYGRGTRLFISSNHSLEEVSARMRIEGKVESHASNGAVTGVSEVHREVSDRIQSRLFEMVTPLEVLGGDYRKIIAERAIKIVANILEEEKKNWQDRID